MSQTNDTTDFLKAIDSLNQTIIVQQQLLETAKEKLHLKQTEVHTEFEHVLLLTEWYRQVLQSFLALEPTSLDLYIESFRSDTQSTMSSYLLDETQRLHKAMESPMHTAGFLDAQKETGDLLSQYLDRTFTMRQITAKKLMAYEDGLSTLLK
eukprot:gnl/Dysnectes_brevis/9546_a17842_192.p1 GENE.gnl/Dysnectes_brevis/9546_a17842_192~~gnl/Dysnectes_brevis/9546_a17842_192.p1  ORF type:complete len:152 (+),score=5.00 gnl/Dysnectes_brevis/9546_a17842_192:73-528(+)